MAEKQNDPHDYMFKVVMIGDSGVGKTQVSRRFINNTFEAQSKSTIGVEFSTKEIVARNGKTYKIQLWDTAGQERFRAITSAYYRGAFGIMVVYDITKADSFINVEKWVKEVDEHAPNKATILLIGNKSDLDHLRCVKVSEAKEYSSSHSYFFLETSAKNGFKAEFNDVFNDFLDDMIDHLQKVRSEERSQDTPQVASSVGEPLKFESSKSGQDTKQCCL